MSRKPPVLGIVGGGQLARMLCEAARALKWETWVLGLPQDESAKKVCSRYFVWEPSQQVEHGEFFRGLSWLTFENEFFPESLEKDISFWESRGLGVFPKLSLLQRIRRKDEQKKMFQNLGIPTLDFLFPERGEKREDFFERARNILGDFVLKLAFGGYDGKGVARSQETLKLQALWDFAQEKKLPLYSESLCHFDQELAMVGARNQAGEIFFYPMVESVQEQGVCDRTFFCEAADSYDLQKEAQNILQKILVSQGYVGLMGVEFFLDKTKGLLVNEIAPRVHNSGHYTLQTGGASQFETHLRAGGELSWGRLGSKKIAMKNILGPQDYVGPVQAPSLSKFDLTWYEKSHSKPFRKLGHVNFEYESQRELEKNFAEIEEALQKWAEGLRDEKSDFKKEV